MKRKERHNKLFAAAMAISVAAVSIFAPSVQESVYAAEKSGNVAETPIQAVASDVTVDKIVAHGGGSIRGFETTNSKQAVEKAISDGYRYIELDMDLSLDNKIIMIHDWDKTAEYYFGRSFDSKLTAEQFSKILVNGSFNTLTFDGLVKILDDAAKQGITDIKIITDTKGDNVALLTKLAENYPDYMKNIIPQIYDYSEYEAVKALGYDEIYLTLYMMDNVDYNQLLNFVNTNDIAAVVIGLDYYIKGLDTKLASAGVKVYCHPVNNFEEACSLLDKGIYGVYSSSLLPQEFTGASSKYYLQQTNKNWQKVKLTDVNLGALTADYIRSITIKGIVGGVMLHYEFDGVTMNDEVLEKAEVGIHELTIDIYMPGRGDQPYCSMTYYVGKYGDELRLTDPKYAYRLEQLKPLPSFESVIQGEAVNSTSSSIKGERLEKIKNILANSFITKKGEYYFFNNGEIGRFCVDDELLNVQSYSNGMSAIPVADTVRALGANWVGMDIAKYLHVNMKYGEPDYVAITGTCYVYRGIKSLKMKSEIEIYRFKALASEEYFSFITGRPYIENEDIAILLPLDTKLTKEDEEDLVKIASNLY